MPLVTFVVPTLDRSSLRTTVESLYAQSDGDWEAIVTGDGLFPVQALDVKRAREPGATASNGKLQVGECPHLGSAGLVRNAIIDRYCRQSGPASEYIAFVDDDDWLRADYVEQLRRHWIADDPDVVLFRMDHPMLGVVPPYSNSRIAHGNAGISYAVRADIFATDGLRFVAEDLSNEGPEGNEDIQLLLRLARDYRVAVSPFITYYVGNTRTVRG